MSREKKYTEGTWIAYEDAGGGFCVRSAVNNNTGISICGWGRVTQTEANANLISAAPDLLEALEEAVHLFRASGSVLVADEFDKAIAKAYGDHHE